MPADGQPVFVGGSVYFDFLPVNGQRRGFKNPRKNQKSWCIIYVCPVTKPPTAQTKTNTMVFYVCFYLGTWRKLNIL